MIKILLDSDVIIDFLRSGQGQLPSLFKLQSENKAELYISAITVLELFAGKSSKQITPDLLELISSFKIIQISTDLAQYAGELRRDNNLAIALADLLVGASALYIKAKLATGNRRHFQKISRLIFY